MNYGEKIARLRKKNNMTQAELGEVLNVTYQAVSKWERGESQPDFDTISKISKLFQVPISYFEDGVEGEADSETSVVTSAQAIQADIIGMCVQCGKVVHEGEEETTHPKLICKACAELNRQAAEERVIAQKKEKDAEIQRKQHKIEYEKAALKKRRNWALIIAAIPAVALIITFLVLALQRNKEEFSFVFGAGCVLAIIAFTFTSQMIWGWDEGIVFEFCTAGGHIMSLPGVIFSLSPDGLIFLIVTKIILFFVAAIVFVGSIFICLFLSLVLSPFSFIPSLLCYNRKIAKVK